MCSKAEDDQNSGRFSGEFCVTGSIPNIDARGCRPEGDGGKRSVLFAA